MMTQSDLQQLQEKGISLQQVQQQLDAFKTGFPFLKIEAAASKKRGIMELSQQDADEYVAKWENYLAGQCTVVKFVPASGAASRMFKDLFEYLDSPDDEMNKSVKEFFDGLTRFAFYAELNETCQKLYGASTEQLIQTNKQKLIVAALLKKDGMNYGNLPKGLLKFHLYPQEQRTPLLEHLAEGAMYAANADNKVNLHFTVSGEHLTFFKSHLQDNVKNYEEKFAVN